MSPASRVTLGALAAVLLAALLVLPAGGSAQAAPIGECTTSTGTIIVVDFSHWGGPIVRGCDTTQPKSGYQLLHDVGFTTAGDSHDGPAFICRIGNQAFGGGAQYPTPSQEPCILTPPASAYWSYWLAPSGQDTSWSYSQLGAMSEVPKAGEIELWIFGGTNIAGTEGRPTCTPASLRPGAAHPAGTCSNASSTPPPATPTQTPTGAPGGSSTHPATTHPGKTATKPTGRSNRPDSTTGSPGAGTTATTTPSDSVSTPSSGSSSTSGDPSTGGTGPGGGTGGSGGRHHHSNSTPADSASRSETAVTSTPPVTASSDPATTGSIVTAEPTAAPSGSHGSVVPLVIGVVLVAGLGGGAAWAMQRRRRPL
jgi:hypothetical protein